MNETLITRYTTWLRSSDRQDSTIRLRLRDIRKLSEIHDLATVTEDDLEQILADRRHLAPETRKALLCSWRLFFDWARNKGHRHDNPAANIRPIRVPIPTPRVAPDEAITAALANANPHHRAMILLARGGWLRLTEIATLHTRQRRGDRLTIRGKGARDRIVYINGEIAAALDNLEAEQGSGHYFPGRRGREHVHPISVNKIITRLTGHNPHSLRHAGATAAWRQTRNLRAVQDMLGHSSLVTTQRYVHLDDDERRAVAEASRLSA